MPEGPVPIVTGVKRGRVERSGHHTLQGSRQDQAGFLANNRLAGGRSTLLLAYDYAWIEGQMTLWTL